jgi:hypothetical protein
MATELETQQAAVEAHVAEAKELEQLAAEAISGSSDTAEDPLGSGEETAAPERGEEQDWVANLPDESRELMESLGLSEEEAREFSGPEELQRHAALLDRQLLRQGQSQDSGTQEAEETSPPVGQEAERPRGEDGRFVKADSPYEPSLPEDEYDEAFIEEFKNLSGYFEGRLQNLEQQLRASEDRYLAAERQQMDVLVDHLGHDDLFGNSSKSVTAKQRQSRGRLLDTVAILQAGMRSLGSEVAATPALMRRALNQEFADQLAEKQRQGFTRDAISQSAKKLGGGPSSFNREGKTEDPLEFLRKVHENMEREAGGK